MSGKQKFHKGDLVQVATDLGASMSHFTSGVRAIVIGSYHDQYGGSNVDSFTLFLEGHGECSWYYASQLTLIEAGRTDLLDEWRKTCDDAKTLHSTRSWIFQHAPTLDSLLKLPGASIAALGRDAGIDNLWGSHGEGYVWYQNAMLVLQIAAPFLERGDEAGWMAFCETKPIRQVRR